MFSKNSYTHVVVRQYRMNAPGILKERLFVCDTMRLPSTHSAIIYQKQPLAHTLDARVKVRVFTPNNTSTLSKSAFLWHTYSTHSAEHKRPEYICTNTAKERERARYIDTQLHRHTDKQQSTVYLQYILTALISTYHNIYMWMYSTHSV